VVGARPWIAAPGGVLVAVRITPKAGRDAIEGIETLADGRAVLRARVRAAPTEGEANKALVRLFADTPTWRRARSVLPLVRRRASNG
jgi:uncharacterized protein YggU (UPF0235/DUF167 family)